MKVVLIRYKPPYEDYEEIIGIATNIDVAHEHIEHLKKTCPHAYVYDSKRFFFEEHEVIEE